MSEIPWGSFFLVAAVSVLATVVLSGTYAGAVRLLSVAREESDGTTRPGALAAAGLCFAVGAAAVLFGLWLVVPQFH